MESTPKSFGRTLALWMGSYAVVALFLFYFTSVPVIALILAGIFTFATTIFKFRLDKR